MNTIIKRNNDLFTDLMDTLFNDSRIFVPEARNHFTSPAVNIKETDEVYEIEVAAPGLDKEDFNIEIEDHVLKLNVNKTVENNEVKENYTRKEFSYFKFERSFNLPKDMVNTDEVDANYINGVLKLTLPKTVEVKESVKKIEVK